jgi:DNA-binding NarL/FixJ family response regulator
MKGLKFIIVEDNIVFRETLKRFLTDEFSSKIIAEVSCGEELTKLNNINAADIIFMNLILPGVNGFEITKKILWDYPFLKVVGIAFFPDDAYLLQLFEAGFKGCLDKNNIFNEISEAVETVMDGQYYFSSSIVRNFNCKN